MKLSDIFESNEFSEESLGLRPYVPFKKENGKWGLMNLDEYEYMLKLNNELSDWYSYVHDIMNRDKKKYWLGSEQSIWARYELMYKTFVERFGSDVMTEKRFYNFLQKDSHNTKFDVLEGLSEIILNKKFGRGKRIFNRANDNFLSRVGVEFSDIEPYLELKRRYRG